MTFFDILKNIFLVLILLHFAPTLFTGIKKQYFEYLEPQTQVAVIHIKGVLYNSAPYTKSLQKYFKDCSIKAILIKMECPGSATGTGQSIYNEIVQLKKQYPKPIIVLVENTCASGGYLIACACDYIIAPSMSVVGSVGTSLSYLFKVKDFLEEHKIHCVPLFAGKYKGSTDPFAELTPEQKSQLQSVADDSYNEFVNIVMNARQLATTHVDEWADGKIFTGNQALKLGLIDEVGSLSNAINIIKDKIIVDGEIEWVHEEMPGGIRSLFWGNESEEDDNSLLGNMVNQTCDMLESRYGGNTRLQA